MLLLKIEERRKMKYFGGLLIFSDKLVNIEVLWL